MVRVGLGFRTATVFLKRFGEVSEWLIEPVSKTGVPLAGTAGSNPALSVVLALEWPFWACLGHFFYCHYLPMRRLPSVGFFLVHAPGTGIPLKVHITIGIIGRIENPLAGGARKAPAFAVCPLSCAWAGGQIWAWLV